MRGEKAPGRRYPVVEEFMMLASSSWAGEVKAFGIQLEEGSASLRARAGAWRYFNALDGVPARVSQPFVCKIKLIF